MLFILRYFKNRMLYIQTAPIDINTHITPTAKTCMLVKLIARKLLFEFVVCVFFSVMFLNIFLVKWFIIELHILHTTATFLFVRLLALRPLLAYCASLG
jgi:hypothetical protein